MRLRTCLVNGRSVAERLLKSELTLSAVGEVAQPRGGSRSVIVEDHGYPLISVEPVPPEAVVRDERDPYIMTELELRRAWGDR